MVFIQTLQSMLAVFLLILTSASF